MNRTVQEDIRLGIPSNSLQVNDSVGTNSAATALASVALSTSSE